ncbi:MAG: hypothetical protein HYZ27_08580, partial [Deltaproteobacteria bacterium]|nr:hypothetical protein [Deltaproteobacteria bacterium]
MVLVAVGVVVGLWLSPETPRQTEKKLQELAHQLAASRAKIAELERALVYRGIEAPAGKSQLKPADRRRHETEGAKYVALLRRGKAQGAAELTDLFVKSWSGLLDHPQPDDRTTRRAALLALLVEEMAKNLNPGDYAPWQVEFFRPWRVEPRGNPRWLGDLHMDLDGDGIPGKRSSPNPRDVFTQVSVCHIAMALNQALLDAQILFSPDLGCERPEARMSVLLKGATLDEALDEFVSAAEREGFLVRERRDGDFRLLVIGRGSR